MFYAMLSEATEDHPFGVVFHSKESDFTEKERVLMEPRAVPTDCECFFGPEIGCIFRDLDSLAPIDALAAVLRHGWNEYADGHQVGDGRDIYHLPFPQRAAAFMKAMQQWNGYVEIHVGGSHKRFDRKEFRRLMNRARVDARIAYRSQQSVAA